MSKQKPACIVPKLRFTEFRETGEWSQSSLEELYSFKATNSLSREKLNYEIGEVKNIHYGDIHTKFSTSFYIKEESVPYINPTESLEKIKHDCYCEEGDMIFADASEDLNDVGKSIEIVNLNNEKLLSGLHTLLARQKKSRLVIGFGRYLFKSSRIRAQIKREAQGVKVLGISARRISRIDVAFPSNKKEQRKIAACLTALDDLIGAAKERLDALKQHKQGLMQKLFPAQGETVPRLRFAEFRDAGEWVEKSLIDTVDESIHWSFAGGPFGSNLKVTDYTSKGIRIIQLQNIGDGEFNEHLEIYTSVEKADELLSCNIFSGDIILSKMGDPVGRACIIPNELERCVMASDGIRLVVDEKKHSKYFIYLLINSKLIRKAIERKSTGSTRKRISLNDLKIVQLILPKKSEQQKIAACLIALDDLIAAQTQKIAKLKTHKRGLMQQLFPAVDEMN